MAKPIPGSTSFPLRIAILAYPGCMGTEIFGVADVLLIAGHIAASLRARRRPVAVVAVAQLQSRSSDWPGAVSPWPAG